MRKPLLYALVGLAAVGIFLYLGLATGALAPYLGVGYDGPGDEEYDHTTVTIIDAETDTELGSVEAAIADTSRKRYVGLSETDELPDDGGMLFVHDSPGEYTYVMRNMSFGIDIVFIDSNGTITRIHEAPEPGPDGDGESQRYAGQGQYVLEVNRGWMADRGIEVGDRVAFEL